MDEADSTDSVQTDESLDGNDYLRREQDENGKVRYVKESLGFEKDVMETQKLVDLAQLDIAKEKNVTHESMKQTVEDLPVLKN